MPDYIEARRQMLRALRAELVGPCELGEEIDFSGEVELDSFDDAAGPFRQKGSGEEVLVSDRPIKRYGVGVLYPIGLESEGEPELSDAEEEAFEPGSPEDAGQENQPGDVGRTSQISDGVSDEDLPLSSANNLRPASFGLSFVANCPPGSEMTANFEGACYFPKEVRIRGRDKPVTWWLRRPVKLTVIFNGSALCDERGTIEPDSVNSDLPPGVVIEVTAISRPMGTNRSLITVSAVNRSAHEGERLDSRCVFQTELACSIAGNANAAILPYEEPERTSSDPELESLALLYRDVPAFAVGHGCAADWAEPHGDKVTLTVMSASLPEVELPSTTPDIPGPDGRPIEIPMGPLAGLGSKTQLNSLYAVVDGYDEWISEQRARLKTLSEEHHATAEEHLALCAQASSRMRAGIAFLEEDELAASAFRLANHAMLLQQARSGHPRRPTIFNRSEQRLEVSGEPVSSSQERGSWRPFQIAFILASIKSTALGNNSDREIVELIFFPTGGGKTEAYLGLAAFSIFFRRLNDPEDVGVDVLMRYTLRLLTAQQFQRAAALICAMDYLRRDNVASLGEAEISIGVWLGSSVTPNKRKEAVASLRELRKQGDAGKNQFVLLRCPWCAAQMGPIDAIGKKQGPEPKVVGYERRGESVVLRCPDRSCEFNEQLPIYVVDEDLYESRPSLVIGTVDKFAMLAFEPRARALFGLGAEARELSPPNLIIQDELHLISGPLGSMVGLYEPLIEELCTDRREEGRVPPKIVGSTATIRRFQKQIFDLYGREEVALFPPRGLDAGDSYFARYARQDGDGPLLPGRIYLGIHGTGLGSVQTAQVRTLATLLQASKGLDAEVRDPYWTILAFFNSLRELGTSLSLLQSDIPDYLRVIRKRLGLAFEDIRSPWAVLELTGRLRNDEVPRAIEQLEQRAGSDEGRAVDVCLASNIVEVGIDIDRLSLMMVLGQPKTTAQYIQATGRIGRSWWERPGLVTTLLSPSKPRDRSHFEMFRSYHERLYAQVEPTSVTPFAPPVLDRALHAVMVAYVRQLGAPDALPEPVPEDLLTSARDLLEARVSLIDPEELVRFEETFHRRLRQWTRWGYRDWLAPSDSEDFGLIRFAGEYADREEQLVSWSVPTSLRNVDAECRASITRAYIREDNNEADLDV